MDHGYRLSPEQERVWQLQKRAQPGAYRCRLLMRIDGEIDRYILKNALSKVQQRHEILRTTFMEPEGMPPLQRAQSVSVFSEHDFIDAIGDEAFNDRREASVWEEAESCALNLTDGPTFAAAFARIARARSLLAISLPAMCGDPASLANLAREIARAYEAVGSGVATSPVQYADFARRKIDLFQSRQAETGLEYWKMSIRPELLTVHFPGEAERASSVVFQPRRCSAGFDSGLVAQCNARAVELGASVIEWLFCCWNAFLWRFSQEKRLAVGYWSDGRKDPESSAALGLYGRYLPVAALLNPDMSIVALWQQIRALLHDQAPLQDYFNCDIVCDSRIGGVRWPALFDFSDLPPATEVGQRRWSILRSATCIDCHKLRLTCVRRENELSAELECDANRFELNQISALAQQFRTFVAASVAEPESGISKLNCTDSAERRRIIVELSRAAPAEAPTGCVHFWFEQRAERFPDELAMIWKDRCVSYRELDQRANALARRLEQLGVTPGTVVGLSMPRSPDLLVGVMGILKAGAAYLALDPTYPNARLEFMLEETRAPVLVTQRRISDLLPRFDGNLLFADEVTSDSTGADSAAMRNEVQPEGLAYVIYTSGSTGQPKGVLIEHRHLANSTWARMKHYREPVGRYLMVSSAAFDSSVAGIFWTLAQGGTLVLPEDEEAHDPRCLVQLIERHRGTHLLCLPSLYRYVLEFAGGDELKSLRCVIVAGEPCPGSLIQEHFRRRPDTKLFNEYGPTEATVWSTVFDAAGYRSGSPVPIGRPVPGSQIYLLDSAQNPVPLGWPGEIYVGGAGVARGYLKRPELTAHKFVRVPVVGEGRLYRTGDIGRFRPDGNLEFLGRLDHQVKIRGYRIELTEIEEILKSHPAIREAVVVAQPSAASPQTNGASTMEGASDIEKLAARLADLDPNQAESLLSLAEKFSPDSAADPSMPLSEPRAAGASDHRVIRSRYFDLSLQIRSPHFVRPPRDSQRNWLLNRAIHEAADDLAHLNEVAKRFVPGAQTDTRAFKTDRSQAILREDEILEEWHRPLMLAMARFVTEQHGEVLEVGFGRGISAGMIQEFGVRSHTIVECNDYIVREFFEPWRARFPDRDIRLIHAKWQDALSLLGNYDGVFFQTFPLNEQEFVDSVSKTATFAEHFFPIAAAHLQNGGVFTYLTHEIDSLSRRHQRLLFKYFRSVTISVERLNVSKDTTDLWWADSMVLIKAVK